ncbi:alcohol dehydrogenase GroES-like protein [Hyaloraphidium curvatum]|nr:alcohol dehydrogenase GroES-like protein [Hyaloraphidium curvatum]
MSLPTTMRAAVMRGQNSKLTIEELPLPAVGDDELLMKVEACGICHTDALLNQVLPLPAEVPHLLGHEGAGTVAAVGKNVTGWSVGDRILSPMHSGSCGECGYCTRGIPTQCAKKIWHAISKPGFFAEYAAVNPANSVRIPDGVSFEQAGPIGCAGVTVHSGLRKCGAKPGELVGISGAGGLGQLAVQIAKSMGMTVVAIDVDDEKLETAKKLGATHAVNAKDPDLPAALRALPGCEEGLQALLVVTNANPAFEVAPKLLRGGGTAVFIGVPSAEMKLDPYMVLNKEIRVMGSFLGNVEDAAAALKLIAEGKIKPLTTPCALEDINDVFHKMDHGRIADRFVVTKFR